MTIIEYHKPRTFKELLDLQCYRNEHVNDHPLTWLDLLCSTLISDSFKNLNKIAVLEAALRDRGHRGRLRPVVPRPADGGTVLQGDEPEYEWVEEASCTPL